MNKKWEIVPGGVILTYPDGLKCKYTKDFIKSIQNKIMSLFNLSQDEIDQIMDELAKQKLDDENDQLSFPNIIVQPGDTFQKRKGATWPPFSGFEIDPASYKDWKENDSPKVCKHEWVEYLGLNDRFLHCKHCGEKKV